MVRRGSRIDDFVEAKRITWASQEVAGRAASRCCRSQERGERWREGRVVVMVVVRDGWIVETAASTPTTVVLVLVLVLLGDGERHFVADSLLHQKRGAAWLLWRPLVRATSRSVVIHEFGCRETPSLVASQADSMTPLLTDSFVNTCPIDQENLRPRH